MTPDIAALRAVLGAERLSTDPALCALHSEDISGTAPAEVAAVARPAKCEDLAEIVRLARATGTAILPRGGGMSYTGGYLPQSANALSLDMSELTRVVELDTVSRHVIVEAGITWAKLHDALAESQMRTPFFGPLSGIAATVGGALSQNGAFFGSASAGYAADHVLGLEIVDGTGAQHRIGAWGLGRDAALPRFGPDLLGLFLGDCGALGIKTRAVLPIEPIPPQPVFASFAFTRAGDVLAAMASLRDVPHLSEVWAMDRTAHRNLAERGFSVLEAAKMAGEVAGRSGSVLGAARNLLAARSMQRAVLSEIDWSLHVVIEPPLADLAEALVRAVARAAGDAGGTGIPDTIPRVTRARPFRAINALIGPKGERWLPAHGVFPAARAPEGYAALSRTLKAHDAAMAQSGITVTTLLAPVGGEILIEPQLSWLDALTTFQIAHSAPAQAQPFHDAPANPQARAMAQQIRADLGAAFRAAGGAHLQVGRYYAYAGDLPDGMRAILDALKTTLDPDGILNPGVLGLPFAPSPPRDRSG